MWSPRQTDKRKNSETHKSMGPTLLSTHRRRETREEGPTPPPLSLRAILPRRPTSTRRERRAAAGEKRWRLTRKTIAGRRPLRASLSTRRHRALPTTPRHHRPLCLLPPHPPHRTSCAAPSSPVSRRPLHAHPLQLAVTRCSLLSHLLLTATRRFFPTGNHAPLPASLWPDDVVRRGSLLQIRL